MKANKKILIIAGGTGGHIYPGIAIADYLKAKDFSIIWLGTKQGMENKLIENHLDLYRLKNEEEAINAGVEDCLYSGNICLVEWPDKLPTIFPEETLHINFELIDLLYCTLCITLANKSAQVNTLILSLFCLLSLFTNSKRF